MPEYDIQQTVSYASCPCAINGAATGPWAIGPWEMGPWPKPWDKLIWGAPSGDHGAIPHGEGAGHAAEGAGHAAEGACHAAAGPHGPGAQRPPWAPGRPKCDPHPLTNAGPHEPTGDHDEATSTTGPIPALAELAIANMTTAITNCNDNVICLISF